MSRAYFNSNIPASYYKKIKIEAVDLNINIKDHIGNILKSYIEKKYPEILDSITTEACIPQASTTNKEK